MDPDDNNPSDNSTEHQRENQGARFHWISHSPVVAASLFEGGLAALAVLIALPLGLAPWELMAAGWDTLLLGLLGTLPLLGLLVVLSRAEWGWVRDLRDNVMPAFMGWFRDTGVAGFGLVAILAGVGEELLFRGVIQDGLQLLWGPWPALIVASLLFGLVHAVSRAYFIAATLMGTYLGAVYLWTGNLLVPIIIHALYDWIALLYYQRRLHR